MAAAAREKRGREEWSAIVDAVLATPRGDPAALEAWTYVERPVSADVRAFIDASTEQVRSCPRPFVPQITFADAALPKPPKAHETDVFADTKEGVVDRAADPAVVAATGGGDGNVAAAALAAVRGARPEELARGIAAMAAQRRLLSVTKRHGSPGPDGKQIGLNRQVNFRPIILVQNSTTVPVQLWNVVRLLQEGTYVDPRYYYRQGDGATQGPEALAAVEVMKKPTEAFVTPGDMYHVERRTRHKVKFNEFRVLDDPTAVTNWDHVCACFVGSGKESQFELFFPDQPKMRALGQLFNRIRGFFPHFEEDRVPPNLKAWQVFPMPLTRKQTKQYAHARTVAFFWEELYAFLDSHPFFRLYTIPEKA